MRWLTDIWRGWTYYIFHEEQDAELLLFLRSQVSDDTEIPSFVKKVLIQLLTLSGLKPLRFCGQSNFRQYPKLEVAPDHIHLFVSVKPTDTPHLVVKAFKGRSSYYLRKEFPSLLKLPSLWTSSYFVSTAGNVSSEAIRRYIEDPHHG